MGSSYRGPLRFERWSVGVTPVLDIVYNIPVRVSACQFGWLAFNLGDGTGKMMALFSRIFQPIIVVVLQFHRTDWQVTPAGNCQFGGIATGCALLVTSLFG